jgi:hypothetical protein
VRIDRARNGQNARAPAPGSRPRTPNCREQLVDYLQTTVKSFSVSILPGGLAATANRQRVAECSLWCLQDGDVIISVTEAATIMARTGPTDYMGAFHLGVIHGRRTHGFVLRGSRIHRPALGASWNRANTFLCFFL